MLLVYLEHIREVQVEYPIRLRAWSAKLLNSTAGTKSSRNSLPDSSQERSTLEEFFETHGVSGRTTWQFDKPAILSEYYRLLDKLPSETEPEQPTPSIQQPPQSLPTYHEPAPASPARPARSSQPLAGQTIKTRVVGVTFEGRQSIIARMHPNEQLWFIREPWNPHDRNAIRVQRMNGEVIGHINRELAARIAPVFDAHGETVLGRATAITGGGPGYNFGVNVTFRLPG